jgi:hypothetical protein
VVGESSGERRRRDRGGAPVVTRTPARPEAVKHNARPRELEGGLGRFGRRRARAEQGAQRWRRQWRDAARTAARDGVGEERTWRPYIRASSGDGGVKARGICRATAPRPAHIRPAPRTDRGSATRTTRVQRRGGAVRGVLGRGECREVWASGGARPRAEEASGRCAGHDRRGSTDDARRAGA